MPSVAATAAVEGVSPPRAEGRSHGSGRGARRWRPASRRRWSHVRGGRRGAPGGGRGSGREISGVARLPGLSGGAHLERRAQLREVGDRARRRRAPRRRRVRVRVAIRRSAAVGAAPALRTAPSELVRSDELRPDELRPLEVRPEEPSWPPDEPFDEPRPSSLADLRLPLPLPLPPDPDMTEPLTPPEPERPELDEPPGSAATAAAVAVVTGGDSDWALARRPRRAAALPAVLAASEREGADALDVDERLAPRRRGRRRPPVERERGRGASESGCAELRRRGIARNCAELRAEKARTLWNHSLETSRTRRRAWRRSRRALSCLTKKAIRRA